MSTDLKTVTNDTDGPTGDTSFVFGADATTDAAPRQYTFGGIKTWIQSWLTKSMVGLSAVANSLQLVAANNLSDLGSVATAKTNLSLVKGDVGLGNVANSLQLVAANNLSDVGSVATTKTNLSLVKGDVGLGNVSNALQLAAANNLSDLTGVALIAQQVGITKAGAASAATFTMSGAIFTGGSGTTTFPLALLQPSTASASTTWSTSGTALGINAPSGFAGNMLDFKVNGATVGIFSASGDLNVGRTFVGGSNGYNFTSSTGPGIFGQGSNGFINLGGDSGGAGAAVGLRAANVVAGFGPSAGGSLTLAGGLSTGSSACGDLLLKTGVKSNSGTVQGTLSTAVTVKGETQNVQVEKSVNVQNSTAIPAGGTAGAGVTFSTTANFGVFFGSGAPTLSAAKGSLYLRSDGSGTSDRAYINTDGATTWTNLTTAA